MIFGVFGKQEASLIINFKSGALAFKQLNKEVKLSQNTFRPGPPPEQDIPLKVPQKTTLFVELTQREREQA